MASALGRIRTVSRYCDAHEVRFPARTVTNGNPWCRRHESACSHAPQEYRFIEFGEFRQAATAEPVWLAGGAPAIRGYRRGIADGAGLRRAAGVRLRGRRVTVLPGVAARESGRAADGPGERPAERA